MPLLERGEELAVLAQALADAAEGRGCLVLIAGEAGIGKTSLIRAFRERAGDGARFLIGACEPLSVPVPLGALRELNEAAGGGDLLELGGDRLALARRILEALGARAPTVAVVEDAHWADPLTLELLCMLARRVEELGVVIAVTYRDDEVAANPALGLLLGDLATGHAVRRASPGRLSGAAVRELAGPSGLDVESLMDVTSGNPFLVVESIAAEGHVPASVRDAALARAGRLSLAAREAVDGAAVLGRRFDPDLLTSLVAAPREAVEEALARGVLVADGRALGFRHELIREAIEGSISPPRRSELHARAARALAERPGPADTARLAHHAELGGLAEDACRYAMLAAQEAERVGAMQQARLQAERALRLGESLAASDRFDLLVQCSRTTNLSSARLEDAVGIAEEAVALACELGDALMRGRALMTLAAARWSLERVAEARAAALEAVRVLEETDDVAELARAHSTVMRMEATAFDPAVAIESAAHALELARRASLEEIDMDIRISVGLAQGHGGEQNAPAVLADALSAARAAGLTMQTVRTYVNLMFVAVTLRAHALAERTAAEALPLFAEFGTPMPAMAIEVLRARSLLDRGGWEEARAIVAGRDPSWQGELPVAQSIEGLIRARRGEPGGKEELEAAWRELRRIVAVESSRHAMMRLALVEAAWLRGDHAGALAELRAARDSPATARFARPAGELALWASRHGQPTDPPAGAPAPVGLEIEGDWRGAIGAWRELDSPYEAALAALPGDDRAAREALAALHSLGAGAAVRAFVRHRAERGGRPTRGPRRSTLANAAGLTRREQEVLEELATGASNAAIAAAFHLSERTVGHHVSAVLRKLGAPSRMAAVERARARGLLAQDRHPAQQR
ncbi:MAG: AAA family ATPase [Acidobacteriota bacterium]|nr:AAA family ATPase [Acidobacteriota bacterium]